jgi:hypothetical protein
MSGFFYYLLTFAESVTSVFGVRLPYDQPRYVVIQDLGQNVEIRQYDRRLEIQATIDNPDRQQAAREAFELLFRYITGANRSDQKIAMTVPVQINNERIPMTVPMQTNPGQGNVTMSFFLPNSIAEAGAPKPLDPRLHLVEVPASTIATLRYSGVATQDTTDRRAAELLAVLATSNWKPLGKIFQLNYDPPFAIPFLRRNEVAVTVSR